jgi:hypothetical protein
MRADYLLYDDDPGDLVVTSETAARDADFAGDDTRSYAFRAAVQAGRFFAVAKDEEKLVVRLLLNEPPVAAEEEAWVERFEAFVAVPCGRLVLSTAWNPYCGGVPREDGRTIVVAVPPGGYGVDGLGYATGDRPAAAVVRFLLRLYPLDRGPPVRRLASGRIPGRTRSVDRSGGGSGPGRSPRILPSSRPLRSPGW